MKLKDAFSVAPVHSPYSGATAEKKVFIHLQQFFFPKILLAPG
jgi:hypothetical protein